MIFTPVIGSRTETGMVLGKKDESWSSFSRYSLFRSVQEFYFRECLLFMGKGELANGRGVTAILCHGYSGYSRAVNIYDYVKSCKR